MKKSSLNSNHSHTCPVGFQMLAARVALVAATIILVVAVLREPPFSGGGGGGGTTRYTNPRSPLPPSSTTTHHPLPSSTTTHHPPLWSTMVKLSSDEREVTAAGFIHQLRAPIPHLVYTPEGRHEYLAPADRPPRPLQGWPAIVFLHGAGEVGTDLHYLRSALGATGALPQLAALSRDAAAAQPADDPFRWSVAERELRSFVVVAPLSSRQWSDADDVRNTLAVIQQLPEKYAVDARNVFLTGVSMGGFGAFHLAMRAPQLFAGVIPLCGFGYPEWATVYAAARLPLLIVHGVNDGIVPFAESMRMIDACSAAGVPDVTLWPLTPSADPLDSPGTGHAAWRNTYTSDRFWAWLRNHTR